MIKLANSNCRISNRLDEAFPLSHVAWAAIEKVGHKQLDSTKIADGSRHMLDLTLSGHINDQKFEQNLAAVVAVGHAREKASSVNPQMPELVGYILSKLNMATRNRILNDIPAEFAANDNQLPVPDELLVEAARHLLKQLRQTKSVFARGPIRCEYSLQ